MHTAAAVLKTSLLQKQMKNHPNLAYKNSVRKCYQVLLFSRNIQGASLQLSPPYYSITVQGDSKQKWIFGSDRT